VQSFPDFHLLWTISRLP